MRPVSSVAGVRAAEAGAGVPESELMARAAFALADTCVDLLSERRGRVTGSRVVAVVGSGNNGGDALWALVGLARRGCGVVAVGVPERMHPTGLAAARRAGARVLDWTDPTAAAALTEADLVLDGVVGIGGRGGLSGPAAELFGLVQAPVVAVDVPSGVTADTGEVTGPAVRAAVTVTFGTLKAGLVVAPGRTHAGALRVADIGLAEDPSPLAHVLDLADLAAPQAADKDHKYSRGVVGIRAGSRAYPGAALLAVGGARASGAGMIAFASASGQEGLADPVAALVIAHAPEVVLAPRAADAWCVGPGLGEGGDQRKAVQEALATTAAVVLDASALDLLRTSTGLSVLTERAATGAVTVLTPHTGEFQRLGFDLAGGPLQAARAAAREIGAVIVLKGPGTVVAAPDGTTFVDTYGTSALASAGTGDVLAGLLAGRLATAMRASGTLPLSEVAHIAAAAVGLHGLAGRLASDGGRPVTASDVVSALPRAGGLAAAARAEVNR